MYGQIDDKQKLHPNIPNCLMLRGIHRGVVYETGSVLSRLCHVGDGQNMSTRKHASCSHNVLFCISDAFLS